MNIDGKKYIKLKREGHYALKTGELIYVQRIGAGQAESRLFGINLLADGSLKIISAGPRVPVDSF